jgi:hypothetical protein
LNKYYLGDDDGDAENAKFEDYGLFQLATVGQQASSTIGELWVTYDIELSKPHVHADVSQGIAAHWQGCNPSLSGVHDWMGGGSTPVKMAGSSSLITYNPTLPNEVHIYKTGRYLMIKKCAGSGLATMDAPTAGTNCTAFDLFNENTQSGYGYIEATATQALAVFACDILISGGFGDYGVINVNGVDYTTINVPEVFVVEWPHGLGSRTTRHSLLSAIAEKVGLDPQVFRVRNNHIVRRPAATESIEDLATPVADRVREVEDRTTKMTLAQWEKEYVRIKPATKPKTKE